MTFEQWWATLTQREQQIIGEHNARFVWQEAVFYTVEEIDSCREQSLKSPAAPSSGSV
jgi:hypothetical protein